MDTLSNRSSAVNVGLGFRSQLPIPDGTIAQGDRQHFAYGYAGIMWGELPAEGKVYGTASVLALVTASVSVLAAVDGTVSVEGP